ncbi:MAG TPA: hypothetical protein VF883_10120 [Thermoanaerobaculia bacterium]|jgi:hypothetical protein
MHRRSFAAIAALTLLLTGCRSLDKSRDRQLSRVARDWCLTIRASQVLPVYPLTEDLQVGDVFLVSTPIEEEVKDLEADGFLPLDNVIARIQPTGWQQFYNGAYGVGDTSVVPRNWQFPEPAPTAPPLTAWSTAPGAAFPSYTFQVKRGAGANLAIPIQSVPVGLSLMQTGDAFGTVNIASASTYGLPISVLAPQVNAWAAKNRAFLRQYGPSTEANGKTEQHYVRVVYRVYVAGGVNVSLINNESRGGRVDAGASKSVALFDAGSTTEAADAAKDYQSMLTALSQSVAAATPSASIQIASASSRGVAINETFPRPLVVGYLAFDRPVNPDGSLGPAIPTHARVTGQPTAGATATFGTDSSADTLRGWLDADPANRARLTDWLSRNAANTSITMFLNGGQFNVLRAKAVQELGIQE